MALREWFIGCAEDRGMSVEEDRNGNLWAWWLPSFWVGDPRDGFVTGSHLDSVPDGGAYDGPLGIISAFAALDILRERGAILTRPVGVVAFSDEEGARFGVACVGSQLSTGALDPQRACGLRDADGITLGEALTRLGRDPLHLGYDPALVQRVGVYVELHVEQGRALDLVDRPLALASSIWPHGRWLFTFRGEANHAGTTPLTDRKDPMVAFASTVHTARRAAEHHRSVATFGKIRVLPNAANAIASEITAWLDARAAAEPILTTLVDDIIETVRGHAYDNGVEVTVEAESVTPIVRFPEEVRRRVQDALAELGGIPIIPTAAGHDAGVLSAKVPTAMLFVRNPSGISHSPEEYARAEDCYAGARALADVMGHWAC